MAPALLWTVAFFVLPFAGMLALSFGRMEGRAVTWALDGGNYARIVTEPAMWGALVNSLEITAVVTGLSVLLAYPLAMVIAFRVPARWQRLALMLAILPFWTSYVVRSYAWLLVLGRTGGEPGAWGLGLGPVELASTRAATVIGFVHFFVMLLTLTIYASLVQLPRNYARAAADLGAGPVRTFVHVICR